MPSVPNDYLTLAQVKAYWPTNEIALSSDWDVTINTLCTNCSRAWDTLTWRRPGRYAVSVSTLRWFDGIPATATDFTDALTIGELADVPSAVVDNGTTVLSNQYWASPYNAVDDFEPYTVLLLNPGGGKPRWGTKLHSIQVTGYFGYSKTVPPDVFEALLLYVIRMVRKGQQNYLEVGTLLDSGQVMIGMRVDPDIQILLEHYRKPRLGNATGPNA